MNTITLKVRMYCIGCVRDIKKAIAKLKGVESIDVDIEHQKVIVCGYVEEKQVIKAIKSIRKIPEPWPYTEVANVVNVSRSPVDEKSNEEKQEDMKKISNGKKKIKYMNTVYFRVKMDDEEYVDKVKKALSELDGVDSVDVDMYYEKVTVSGYVDEEDVMKAIESTGEKPEPWEYVRYTEVANPYDPRVYNPNARVMSGDY